MVTGLNAYEYSIGLVRHEKIYTTLIGLVGRSDSFTK